MPQQVPPPDRRPGPPPVPDPRVRPLPGAPALRAARRRTANTGPVPRPPVATFGAAFDPPPSPNRLALVALVLAIVVPLVGLVLGVVARSQIASRTAAGRPEGGKGVATAAVVVGGVLTALVVAAVVLALVFAPDVSKLLTRDLAPTTVAQTIATTAGYPAGSVTCLEGLPATVGATTVCAVAVPGQPTSVRATVTSVAGRQVLFDVVPQ